MKWFESSKADSEIVISSRVRLARNLKKYPFRSRLSKDKAIEAINEVKASILNNRTSLGDRFTYFDINSISETERLGLIESHAISPKLGEDRLPSGALVLDDYSISIMLNEEDHIRIQTFGAGECIDEVFDTADKIDNLMEESLEVAFDDKYGYITACPTNFGTGLRASYMMHLPSLEQTGQIKNIIQSVGKYGITVRGIYGEGSEAFGSIYQLSNQITLGKSESEIIELLKKVKDIVVERELNMRNYLIKNDEIGYKDRVYRAYGILENAKTLSTKEALEYLSHIRDGYLSKELLKKKPKTPIYNIMTNIQPGMLQKMENKAMSPKLRDIKRAEYINECFNE